MFSFRQKIFATYVFVILILIALIYPFSQRTVKNIVIKGMEDRTTELIAKIRNVPSNDALIRKLKESKAIIFFRISAITNERKLLYDSHTKRILGPRFSQAFIVSHPEVLEAFKKGSGYNEEYSDILEQEFAYFAKAFDFHGKTYVLRTSFPLRYVEEVTKDFQMFFLISAIVILLLFSAMTWFIIHYLTRPIQQIITTVKPYQEGSSPFVPQIELRPKNRSDEFGQLANILNSLSIKIRRQIESVTTERNEKKAVLESLVEGVVAVDNQMIITYINSMAAKLLEIESERVLDTTASSLNQKECFTLLVKCQKENAVLHGTIELKRRRKTLYLDIVAAPKTDKTGAILVLQDKTQHNKIIAMRKDFVANASHELKTPIQIILGFAETLHDNPNLSPKVYGEITGKIVKNCHRMNMLIKDLLILTDIEHIPESRLLHCDLVDCAKNVIGTMEDRYPEAQIVLECDQTENYTISADPKLIELCLTNLVANGVKYSPDAAEITITLSKNKKWVIIAVKDKGMGIESSEIENIFQRFYRSENSRSNKKIGGSGLGLSIVEMIVSKHFGKIIVDSVVGEGSTFFVYLPRERETSKKTDS